MHPRSSFPTALPLLVLFYILGIVCEYVFHIAAPWVYGFLSVGSILVLLSFLYKQSQSLALLLWVGTLGSVAALPKHNRPHWLFNSSPEQFSSKTSEKHTFFYAGRVLSMPQQRAQSITFRMRIEQVRIGNQSPGAWAIQSNPAYIEVYLKGQPTELILPGDWVWFPAHLHPPQGFQNSIGIGTTQADFLENTDAFAGLQADELIKQVPPPPLSWKDVDLQGLALIYKLRLQLLTYLRQTLQPNSHVDPTPYALLSSLTLGERGPLAKADDYRIAQGKKPTNDAFRDAGVYHILSVSGFHLAIVSLLSYILLAALLLRIPGWPSRWPAKRIAALGGICTTILYTLLTGAETATLRAAGMAVFGFLAIVCGRRTTVAESIMFAIFCIIHPGAHPLAIFDPSLQLSVGAVLGICYLHPLQFLWRHVHAKKYFQTLSLQDKLPKPIFWLGQKILVLLDATVAATLVTTPLCALYFFQFQASSPLGNLLVLPLGELLVLPIGMLGLCLAIFCPWLAGILLKIAGFFASVLMGYIDFVATLPLSFWVKAPTLGMVFLWFAGLVFSTFRVKLGAFLITMALSWYFADWFWLHSSLKVTFLNVGQGDAAVIELPKRKVLIIDGGGLVGSSFDPGNRIVIPFLRSRGYAKIDLLVASHAHPDHVQGLISVLEQFPVAEIWANELPHDVPKSKPISESKKIQSAWQHILDLARDKQIPIHLPYAKEMGPVHLEPLGPCSSNVDCLVSKNKEWSENNNSLVLLVSYANRKMLFPGDIEKEAEAALLDRWMGVTSLHTDILKAPHHCSKTSSTEAFVQAVSPSWVICSVGYHNRFGFPHNEVVQRYQEQKTQLLRTDQRGGITFTIFPDGQTKISTSP